ncbi:hypothetical protein RB195_003350 [Necator americanus]|uniref:Methyltransferase FkbM domain-containing protein n=1 Tax=Necator americanus TaxID=51031 RepID=A0ABR1DN65_NECAM
MRRSDGPIILVLCIVIFCLFSLQSYPKYQLDQVDTGPDPRVKGQFNDWKKCIETNISVYKKDANGLWFNLWKGVKLCEKLPFMADLQIEMFHNKDETKYHIRSLQKPSVIVTLGIGHDTAAEESLVKRLPEGSEFYGADPMHEGNEELFTKFGSYFPFAVGAKSQVSTANVLINDTYVGRSVVQIDLAYFLSEIIKHKVYDDLWIDAEEAEYDMFPYFYRGGELDQNGIVLCQFNMEVHRWDEDVMKERFRDFLFKILEENRYAFFRPVQGNHLRLYFLNFADKHCVSKTMRRSEGPIILVLCVVIFCLFSLQNYPKYQLDQMDTGPDPRVKEQFNEWKKCIETNISIYENDAKGLWWNLWKGVKLCEKLPFMADLEIENFNNGDETKRHIRSLQKPSVIVTLGIGHDTAAEEALVKVLPEGSKFYGADPMHEGNEELYKKFGSYFPFAVGAKSQVSTANVLINGTYVDKNVVHIDLAYFLAEIIKHKVYDDIWIDAEGAEYDMFPYFYQGGELDQNGIVLCQFNMEVHNPDDAMKERFREYLFKILEGNRYAFFRPVQGKHLRLYFLNFANKHCVSKYVIRETT